MSQITGKRRYSSNVASPFSPYSIQKRPKPQICPKFVPAIVFGGSSQGDENLKKIVKICPKIAVFQIFDKFFQIFVPLTGTPKNNRWDKFWTTLGFRAFLNAVRGKRARNSNAQFRGQRVTLHGATRHTSAALLMSKPGSSETPPSLETMITLRAGNSLINLVRRRLVN